MGSIFCWFESKEDLMATIMATKKESHYSCADFPNVPLIGTKGCINYNPVLAQRQFGYPI